MGQYIKSWKGKTYLARLLLRFDGKNENFRNKQKLSSAPTNQLYKMFFNLFFLCWCTVDLQYVLVSGVRQSDSVIPISLFVQILFLSRLLQNVEFPVLHRRPLLSIYFMYSSVYMLIPVPQFIPPPHLSALVTLSLFSFLLFNFPGSAKNTV